MSTLRSRSLLALLVASLLGGAPDAGASRGARTAEAAATRAEASAASSKSTTGRARKPRTTPLGRGKKAAARGAVRAKAEATAGKPTRAQVSRAIRRMQRTLGKADPRAGIRQITGKDLEVGQTTFGTRMPADPFVDVLPDGKVHVYGTFENYLEFDSLDDMLRGGAFRAKPIPTDEYLANEASWDHMIHRWEDGSEVMYAGMMTATEGRSKPAWPADNWNRRIYGFTRDQRTGKWVKHHKPLFGATDPDQRPTMIGHAYGHHFQTHTRVVDGKPVKETWLYHEEIVGEHPLRTEIFARKMIDPLTASEHKVRILGVDPARAPELGKRASGEYLVEGPRPFEVTIDGEPYSMVAFSSGDFNSDNYDMNFAWKKGTEVGEHTPMLDPSSRTPKLRGFGQELKQRYDLSWLGRAHVVQDERGQHWAVFHAVNKRIRPDVEYTRPEGGLGQMQRNIYAVPLRFSRGADGTPRIEVLDRPEAERPASASATSSTSAAQSPTRLRKLAM